MLHNVTYGPRYTYMYSHLYTGVYWSILEYTGVYVYSETCASGHLYSETTCIKRPLHDVPKVSAQYILTCIQRPPLYKGHYEVALAWPLNTGFTVYVLEYMEYTEYTGVYWSILEYVYIYTGVYWSIYITCILEYTGVLLHYRRCSKPHCLRIS